MLATSNPADYHHFDHLGWLAPGYQADVLCFDSLTGLRAAARLAGREARGSGRSDRAGRGSDTPAPDWMRRSVHLPTPPGADQLDLVPPADGSARVIGIASDTLTTRHLVLDVTDPANVVARIAVVERHRETGRIGLGYVAGLRAEAGCDRLYRRPRRPQLHGRRRARRLRPRRHGRPRWRGSPSSAAARSPSLDGQVLAEVALPIGGLMSDRSAGEVAGEVDHLAASPPSTSGSRSLRRSCSSASSVSLSSPSCGSRTVAWSTSSASRSTELSPT